MTVMFTLFITVMNLSTRPMWTEASAALIKRETADLGLKNRSRIHDLIIPQTVQNLLYCRRYRMVISNNVKLILIFLFWIEVSRTLLENESNLF